MVYFSEHGEGVFVICVFETGNNQINQFNSNCEHHSIVITLVKMFDRLSSFVANLMNFVMVSLKRGLLHAIYIF